MVSKTRQNQVLNLVLSHNLDIFCLTETKLSDNTVPLVNCVPNGYSVFHASRKNRSKTGAGGVGILVRDMFHAVNQVNLDVELKTFEALILNIIPYKNAIPLTIICVYRPPQTKLNLFFKEFEALCNRFITDNEPAPVIILGDFNIAMNKTSDSATIKMANLLNDIALQNKIETPTFRKSQNTIDLLLDSYVDPWVTDVFVKDAISFSDHALIEFNLKPLTTLSRKSRKEISVTKTNDISMQNFDDLLTELQPPGRSALTSLELTQALRRNVWHAFDESFDKLIAVITTIPGKNWYNGDCKKAKAAFREAETIFRKNQTDENRKNMNKLRNLSVRAIGKAKEDYYYNNFLASKRNPRKIYQLYNELTGNKKVTTLPDICTENPEEFDNEYADFLISKITNLRQGFRESDVEANTQGSCSSTLSKFKEINIETLSKIMSKVKTTYCKALDPIDFRKIDLDIIKPYLLEIVNTVLTSGIFPESEKLSIIYPKIKDIKGNKNEYANYRPISNISYIGKVIENCIYEQLKEHFEENQILPTNQSAYRSNFSTETAITRLYSDLITTKESGKSTMLVSIDLSAAFDTVDHDILLNDLSTCNVQNLAHATITSYLKGRKFKVKCSDTRAESSERPLQWGVPQGSVLGPLLFIFYTRSLAEALNNIGVKFQIYADDTLIYFTFDDVTTAKVKLTEIFEIIQQWMSSKKLKLNISKTALLIVSPNLISDSIYNEFRSFEYKSETMTPVKELKYLGVIFDNRLSFDSQINNLVKKLNFAIFSLKSVITF